MEPFEAMAALSHHARTEGLHDVLDETIGNPSARVLVTRFAYQYAVVGWAVDVVATILESIGLGRRS
jgi:hypothetical protein